MTKSICDDEIPAAIRTALIEARRLQVERMEKAFSEGWCVPSDIAQRYRQWYASASREHRDEYYKVICEHFIEEVRERVGFPPEWTSLDPVTLFGEICTGERN